MVTLENRYPLFPSITIDQHWLLATYAETPADTRSGYTLNGTFRINFRWKHILVVKGSQGLLPLLCIIKKILKIPMKLKEIWSARGWHRGRFLYFGVTSSCIKLPTIKRNFPMKNTCPHSLHWFRRDAKVLHLPGLYIHSNAVLGKRPVMTFHLRQ